jgi:hypothetical protein
MVKVKTLCCVFCNEFSEVSMTPNQFWQYRNHRRGEVENIFSEWPAAKQELLITGTHEECWDKALARA